MCGVSLCGGTSRGGIFYVSGINPNLALWWGGGEMGGGVTLTSCG